MYMMKCEACDYQTDLESHYLKHIVVMHNFNNSDILRMMERNSR